MIFKQKIVMNLNSIKINDLSNKLKLDKKIIQLLFLRGYDTLDKIQKFITPQVTQLYNPFLLKGMQKCVDLINSSIANSHKIVILGDYDADGISASAILYKYFESKNIICNVFLPNRTLDGYGITNDTLDKIKSLYNPDLIITVDCGISSHNEVEYCKTLGIDIIITDHHDIPDILPNCIVINPKIPGQLYPFKDLCGAGVALKVVQALGGINEALKYVTIASLATIADIVPLLDENRAIVYFGLRNQTNQLPLGLKKLAKKLNIDIPMTSQDVSFRFAPKINATGRMGDAFISFKLYIEKNELEINKSINELLELNDRRVNETNVIFNDCIEMLKDINVARLGIIVLKNDNWESGVLGIICSKLVDIYNKPVCLVTKLEGEYKGSLRSVSGIDIFDAVSAVKSNLVKFGGHNQASGISIKTNYYYKFKTDINNYILEKYGKDVLIETKYYDLEVNNDDIDINFVEQMNLLEPFGLKNEKPNFKITFSSCNVSKMSNYPQHLKIQLGQNKLIAFNKGQYYYNLLSNSTKELIVDYNKEAYGNKNKVVGFVKNINYSKLNTPSKSEIINASYLNQLKYISIPNKDFNVQYMPKEKILQKLNKVTKSNLFGNLVIINLMPTYMEFVKTNNIIKNFELFNLNNSNGENSVIFSPISQNNFVSYENIYILDAPLTAGYINQLSSKYKRIYVNDELFDLNVLKGISLNRDDFANYHKLINDYDAKITNAFDIISYYNSLLKISKKYKEINYNMFTFVMLVFDELNIAHFENGHINFNKIKTELQKSQIYNYINMLIKVKDK